MFKLSKQINLFGFFLFFLSLCLCLKFSFISSDAPYYLSVSRDIAKGLVPYKDIYLSYTPLMMYLNASLFLLSEDLSYNFFLLFQVLIIIISLFIYLKIIIESFQLSGSSSFFLTLVLGIAILSSDGNYINLEVYSILSVLAAIYFYKNQNFFFTGFFLGVSFLFKQYGILNFAPFILLIFSANTKILYRILLVGLGGVLPVLLFLIYFVFLEKVELISIIEQLSGVKYIQYATGKSQSFYNWILGAKVFLILFIPIVIFLRSKLVKRGNLPWLIGILIFLIPTILQSFQHYFINTLPYIFVLLAANWKPNLPAISKSLILGSLIMVLILNIRLVRYKDVYTRQVYLSELMQSYLPKGSSVFLNGGVRFLYFLNKYDNPMKEKIGYSYFHFLDTEHFKNIKILSENPIKDISFKTIILKNRIFYLKL